MPKATSSVYSYMLMDAPPDCLDIIRTHLAKQDDLRCAGDVARDAAALSLTCKTLLTHGTQLHLTLVACPWDRFQPPESRTMDLEHDRCTISDLKGLLTKWRLPTSGTKRELFDRLRVEVKRTRVGRYWCPISESRRKAICDTKWLELCYVSKKYLLKPADREHLRTHMRFMGSRYGTREWLAADVFAKCLEKHGGEAGWREAVRRLQARRAVTTSRAEVQRERRRERLTAALEAQGCQLRSDSRLCDAYINDNDGDIDMIVRVMEQMHFYHTHTEYAQAYEDERRAELEYKGRYDPDEISDTAKTIALSAWVMTFDSNEAAASHAHLPTSLRARVLSYRR
jgi:hypothetical protein